jgi:hypothetical protein
MAEEQVEEKAEGEESSPLIKNVIMLGLAVVVPALIAVVLFKWVIQPKFGTPEDVDMPPAVTDPFPEGMVDIEFTNLQITVRTEDPEMVAPMLIAEVALWCRDGATQIAVDGKKNLFQSMILKLHQGRTRSELNDPLIQNSILEQIKQQANILLRRLDAEMEYEVLSAAHLKYTIVDL